MFVEHTFNTHHNIKEVHFVDDGQQEVAIGWWRRFIDIIDKRISTKTTESGRFFSRSLIPIALLVIAVLASVMIIIISLQQFL